MKIKYKKIGTMIVSLILITAMFSSCSLLNNKEDSNDTSTVENSADTAAIDTSLQIPQPDGDDLQGEIDISSAVQVTFKGTEIQGGTGVSVSGKTVTISKAGIYVLSGTGTDNQVIVDAGDNDIIKLVLNNADITSKQSSAIYVKNAGKVIVNSPVGTVNSLSDASAYSGQSSDGEPDSAIFSKDNLTFNGSGTLNITANCNDAVKSKDTLIITGSTLNITSTDDGIIGKDYVVITDGTFNIDAKGDGIKSTYDTDTIKGAVAISGGTFNITAGADGVQAQTKISVSGGTFNLKTGGGNTNAAVHANDNSGGFGGKSAAVTTTDTDSNSYKGIKCSYIIEIGGGEFTIDSADDAIHSNNTVTISGGKFNISTGDDGVHADTVLNYNNADMNILTCYEGLESSTMNFSGGSIHLKADDDGLNAAGGNDSSNQNGPMGGDPFGQSSNAIINISGGYLYIDADGDGVDSNGSVQMSGGTVIVNGPTNSGNGALDYNSEFKMTGGTLIAAGASGMAQTISSSSTVYAVSIGFSQSISETAVRLLDSSGNDIVSFIPSKTISNIVIASPVIKQNGSYTVKTSALVSGSNNDGLITDGKFNNETQVGTFTASSILSSVGSSSGSMGGMGGGNPQGGGKGGGNMPQGGFSGNQPQ